MKLYKKCILIAFSVVMFIMSVLIIFVMISFDRNTGRNTPENYLEEKNNTVIASGMDGYVFKINDDVLFHVLDNKGEIMKTDLTYNDSYSDLVANSKVIFPFNDAEKTYYLIQDNIIYIKNNSNKKCIDLSTLKITDFTDNQIKGKWDTFQ